jgi:putative inorganic carbon (hco3(-)) transporter
MRSVYVLFVYLSFLVLGIAAPFVFSLGYVWTDTFSPQAVSYIILPSIPVSLIMGGASLVGYFMLDRRFPRASTTTVLLIIFAIWITVTTFGWAVVPGPAYGKWNLAVKTVLMGAFLPFIFRSRVHIEAFLLVWMFSLSVQILPFGIKTMYSGGGYGQNLGVVGGNSLLAEGSTLASVALCLVPLLVHFYKYSVILPKTRLVKLGLIGYGILCFAAAIGTYERTALVSMMVLGIGMWIRSKHKISFIFIAAAITGVILYFADGAWTDRIQTTANYSSENSAYGRILVWKWTLDYISQHPLGGGFDMYRIDSITYPPDPDGSVITILGKAFHSSWFEVLGEHGWPGLGIFVTIIGVTVLQLQLAARRAKGVIGLEWIASLAYSLQIALFALLAGATFVGIAFQPMIYYLLAASTCLHNYMKQSDRLMGIEMRRQTRLGIKDETKNSLVAI